MTVAKPAAAADWPGALERACAGEGLRAVYQPLVDLARGLVIGYEAFIRFGGLTDERPDQWFAAARAHGCEAELEAAALATTLRARADLAPDLSLSVNVSPTALASPPVAAVLDRCPDLRGVVLELTEQAPLDNYSELRRHLDRHRLRGAQLAIDDAGSGYAGLAHLLELRPAIVKLDRTLIRDVDRDEAKRFLIGMLVSYASHLDAFVLAEGIETLTELSTLRGLGVPLGQGIVLARPSPRWSRIDERAVAALRTAPAPEIDPGCMVGLLLERVELSVLSGGRSAAAKVATSDADGYVVIVDPHQRPVAGTVRSGPDAGRDRPVLAVSLMTSVADVAFRALTRPAEHRFDPIVCTDPAGRVLGIVRMERILDLLARVASRA
jgi:EAL domain-containing protein (putative c-di-GMP-specific phosphodiesterase class I)